MNIALIQWGGITIGKRPSTALAVIRRPKRSTPYVELINNDGSPRFKNTKKLDDTWILHEWPENYWPSPRERKAAKANLEVITE